MTRFRLFLTSLLGIAPLAGHSPALAADRQDARETLSAALAKRPVTDRSIVAVGADRVSLPAGQPPPTESDPLPRAAADYGMIVQDFGSVEAVAPATTYRYTENPADPNPFEGMDADQIVPLLMGSLSEGQWKALIGKRGLALSDLTSEEQRALFLALFPGHQVRIAPIAAPTAEDFKRIASSGQGADTPKSGTIQDLTAQIANARLFLGLKTALSIPVQPPGATSPAFVMPSGVFPAGAPPFYRLVRPEEPEGNDLFGIPVRKTVPNTPKEGDLDWNLSGLKTAVDCGSAKTVGQLVARISTATKMEIYADRQIENRTVTIAGKGALEAGDLLRAVALCVAGTYRKVGPIYVLTEDLRGRAVLRQQWVDLQGEVDAIKAEAGRQTTAPVRHGWGELDVLPGALSPSPEQRNSVTAHFPVTAAETAFKDLTPEEKETALKEVDSLNMRATAFGTEQIPPPTPDTLIRAHIYPSFQVEIPTLPGPIAFDSDMTSSFSQEKGAPDAGQTVADTPKAKIPVPVTAAPVDLAGIVRSMPHRAVLAQPGTAQSVDTLIESMRKIGLNELWLDMFSDGRPRASQSVLDEALKAGAKAGIRVLPTIDLWLWDKDSDGMVPDRNIYGDDSREADVRQMRFYGRHEIETEDIDAPEQPVYDRVFVDPAAPAVADMLTPLIKSLAANPAVTGMVWRDTDPAGYRVSDLGDAATAGDLGYTDDLRLGFLRAAHADPIDILPGGYAKIDSFLRAGGDISSGDDQNTRWRQFRSDAKLQALGSLYKAAQTAAGPDRRITIMLRQDGYNRNGTGWYGSWDGPPHPVPLYRSSSHSLQDLQNGTLPGTAVGQAKAQSAEALYLAPPASVFDAARLAQDLQANVTGKKWDGFVIDVRTDSIPFRTSGTYPADPLAKFVSQAPPIPLPH